jgi:hypothetical protein
MLMPASQLRKVTLMDIVISHVSNDIRAVQRQRMRTPQEESSKNIVHARLISLQKLRINIACGQGRISIAIDERIGTIISPSCLVLCANIQQYLPKELRDMVYQYLLPSEDVLIGEDDFIPFDSPESSQSRLTRSSHLIRPGVCDAQTRQEFFEAWYKNCTFQFCTIDLIPQFLHKDLWGLDLPVRTLVRHLNIDIWPPDRISNTEFTGVKDSAGLLGCLLAVRPGAEFVFPIDTNRYSEIWRRSEADIRKFVVVLTRFCASAKRVLKAGHKVIVELDGDIEVDLKYEHLNQAVWHDMISQKARVSSANIVPNGNTLKGIQKKSVNSE